MASILLVIIAIASIVIGIVYVSTPKIMWYHENFIGMTHEEISGINPKLADMMLVFLRGAGVLNFSLGILGIAVSLRSFREGEKWAWYAMLISYLVAFLPVLAITHYVGALTPFLVIFIMLVVFLAAIVLSAKEIFG